MNTNHITLFGAAVIQNIEWVHLAVVYDVIIYQQQIYINGKIDGSSQSYGATLRGTSFGSTTTIGRGVSFAYGISVFHRYDLSS